MTRRTSREPNDDDASTEQSNNTPGTVPDDATTNNRVSRRSVLRAASVAGITATTGLGAIAITSTPALAANASLENPGELTAGDTIEIDEVEISYSDLDTASDIAVTYRITGTEEDTSSSYGITSSSGDVTTTSETLTVPDVSSEVTGATLEIVVSHGETSTTVTSNSFTSNSFTIRAEASRNIITDVDELQAINEDLDADYVLGNDIDASETESWNGGDGFNPIGSYGNPFTGEFDGNGYEITGLTIDRADRSVGLFGGLDGEIKNVGLVDINVSSSDDYVGGLVGHNEGNVSNSYATGNVTGQWRVGGLVGWSGSGSVSNSYATGSVTGDYKVGGLVGQNGGDVSNSYATGNVTENGFGQVGGLVGQNGGNVSGSYWDTETTGQSSSAGLPDENGLTTSEMQGDAAAVNMTAFDFTDTWTTVTGDYPELRN